MCTHGRGRRPGREQGIVRRRRPAADDDRIHSATKLMDQLPRLGTGDPAAVAGPRCNFPIERHGPLGYDPGPALRKEFQIGRIELSSCVFQDAGLHLNAGIAEFCQPAAVNLASFQCMGRVGHSGHHAGHSGRQQGARAGRGLALVAAWLQRDVERCPAGPRAGNPQGLDLGMRLAEAAMPAFAHDLRRRERSRSRPSGSARRGPALGKPIPRPVACAKNREMPGRKAEGGRMKDEG